MKLIRKTAKGFTLTELIVVMAIIGVLTATLVVGISAYLRDKKYDDANAKAETIYRALQVKLNQYEVSGHMTFAAADPTVRYEGIAGVGRAITGTQYLYISNSSNQTDIGRANICDGGGALFTGSTVTKYDGNAHATGELNQLFMSTEIRGLSTSSRYTLDGTNPNKVTSGVCPSWLAKIDMQTYTVCYVLYTEDLYDLTNSSNGFLDRTSTDTEGYYVDVYEQQSTAERVNRNYAIVGCYPMQNGI